MVVIVLIQKLAPGPCLRGGRSAQADSAPGASPSAAAPGDAGSSRAACQTADDAVPALLRTPLGAVAAPVLLVAVAEGLPLLGKLASAVAAGGDWSLLPFVLYPLVGCPATIRCSTLTADGTAFP